MATTNKGAAASDLFSNMELLRQHHLVVDAELFTAEANQLLKDVGLGATLPGKCPEDRAYTTKNLKGIADSMVRVLKLFPLSSHMLRVVPYVDMRHWAIEENVAGLHLSIEVTLVECKTPIAKIEIHSERLTIDWLINRNSRRKDKTSMCDASDLKGQTKNYTKWFTAWNKETGGADKRKERMDMFLARHTDMQATVKSMAKEACELAGVDLAQVSVVPNYSGSDSFSLRYRIRHDMTNTTLAVMAIDIDENTDQPHFGYRYDVLKVASKLHWEALGFKEFDLLVEYGEEITKVD